MFGDIAFRAFKNERWQTLPTISFHLPTLIQNEILEQYELRRAFYVELIELIDNAEKLQAQLPTDTQTPYAWDSDHAELEIAELLYAIQLTKLKINPQSSGSIAKFKKAFYKLFGLDSKRDRQKVQQIRARRTKSSLHELADTIDNLYKKPD